jgi:serine/threonine protein kinase
MVLQKGSQEIPNKTTDKNKTIEIKLLNQGTFGCIFQPGINCEGAPDKNLKMVSKVQILNKKKNNEIEIGKIVMSITHYNSYFAPIIKSCPINIANLPDNTVSKCKILNSNTPNSLIEKKEYITNKMRFVGELLLQSYLIRFNESPFIAVLIQSMTHLLIALDKLYTKGIIHYDLSIGNIVYDKNNSTPIIIDFGLSIIPAEIKRLNTYESYSSAFYIFHIYQFWCIEIFIISYIINKNCPIELKQSNNLSQNRSPATIEPKVVTEEKMKELIDLFISTNELFDSNKSGIFTLKEPADFKTNLVSHFTKYYGKTWKYLLDELFQEINYSTWDNYSLSVVYLNIIKKSPLPNLENNIKIQKIIEHLKIIVFSMPLERPSIKTTQSFIKIVNRNL